jgi:hypothetical protein
VRRFAGREVVPYAQECHHRDQLIALPVIAEVAEFGVLPDDAASPAAAIGSAAAE